MTPIPKKSSAPFDTTNARGVLLSSCLGKVHARVIRSAVLPSVRWSCLPDAAWGFSHMSIEFGNRLVHQRTAHSKKLGVSSAVIFVDMVAAFYRMLPELTLGPLLSDAGRQLLTSQVLAPVALSLAEYVARVTSVILKWGAPAWVARAVADWHAHT